jgi:hypothetical protein
VYSDRASPGNRGCENASFRVYIGRPPSPSSPRPASPAAARQESRPSPVAEEEWLKWLHRERPRQATSEGRVRGEGIFLRPFCCTILLQHHLSASFLLYHLAATQGSVGLLTFHCSAYLGYASGQSGTRSSNHSVICTRGTNTENGSREFTGKVRRDVRVVRTEQGRDVRPIYTGRRAPSRPQRRPSPSTPAAT